MEAIGDNTPAVNFNQPDAGLIKDSSAASFVRDVIEASKTRPVLVDFWAPWCGPCRMLIPILEELAKEYDGKVKVAKLNTDEHPSASGRFRISAIPTMLFFKGGKLADKRVGVLSKDGIKTILDGLLDETPPLPDRRPRLPP